MSKNRIGRVERAVTRSFIASNGRPVRTADLLARAFARERRFHPKHYRSLYRATLKYAIKLERSERGKGRPWLWGPTPELLRWIRGE